MPFMYADEKRIRETQRQHQDALEQLDAELETTRHKLLRTDSLESQNSQLAVANQKLSAQVRELEHSQMGKEKEFKLC